MSFQCEPGLQCPNQEASVKPGPVSLHPSKTLTPSSKEQRLLLPSATICGISIAIVRRGWGSLIESKGMPGFYRCILLCRHTHTHTQPTYIVVGVATKLLYKRDGQKWGGRSRVLNLLRSLNRIPGLWLANKGCCERK